MKSFLSNPRRTSLAVIILSAIGFFTVANDADNNNDGIALIIIMWIPFILGVLSLMLYFIVRYFSKDYAWIIGMIALILQLFIIVKAVA